LIEPFLGSGVVSLNSDYQRFVWNDINKDLIAFLREVKSGGDAFIAEARKLFTPAHNEAVVYYDLREEFNGPTTRRRRATLFLYLNRHGFNGLCRYNSSGGFNVPFGKFKRPYFPEAELRHAAMVAKQARLECRDFARVMEAAKQGDVIYCDPPYVPLSPTAYFTSYDASGFTLEDQLRLAAAARQACDRGVHVLVSNHLTYFTKKAYKGARLHTFEVQRQISRDGTNRKKITEVLAHFAPGRVRKVAA
jgi:DNA adenine methylase